MMVFAAGTYERNVGSAARTTEIRHPAEQNEAALARSFPCKNRYPNTSETFRRLIRIFSPLLVWMVAPVRIPTG